MKLFNAYKTKTTIEGKIKDVLISIEVENAETIDFSYWDKLSMIQTQNDINQKKIQCLYIMVRAQFSGLEGFEGYHSLNQVFISNSNFTKDITQSVKIHNMAENAIKDLTSKVLIGTSTLNNFLNDGTYEK